MVSSALIYAQNAMVETVEQLVTPFLPVLHDWYNKGRGMCYPVCGMVHINETLAVNRKE